MMSKSATEMIDGPGQESDMNAMGMRLVVPMKPLLVEVGAYELE